MSSTRERPTSILENDSEVFLHPAFGQITVSRVNSSEAISLYGSELPHNRFIQLTINASDLKRSYSKDRPFARKQLAQLMMTEAQWCELLSSMNAGSGTQCTLLHVGDEKMPGIEGLKTMGEKFESDASKDIDEAEKTLAELKLLIEASGLSKKKTEELVNATNKAHQRITSSRAFILKSFQGQMEGVVQKAKIEINAHAKQVLGGEPSFLTLDNKNSSEGS
ncbi:MAG: hypothetical protein ACTS9Y_00225 [Methylophilus sp.]|uniref:hypothetical protein n=1 Tax=Methylophilus sp. TaxID=29541 RepID=UPI003F9FC666